MLFSVVVLSAMLAYEVASNTKLLREAEEAKFRAAVEKARADRAEEELRNFHERTTL